MGACLHIYILCPWCTSELVVGGGVIYVHKTTYLNTTIVAKCMYCMVSLLSTEIEYKKKVEF